jgi:hypothetical protein
MEAMVRKESEAPEPKSAKAETDPNVRDLFERLSSRFGTKVKYAGTLAKGKIVLEYYSTEEFERLVEELLP